MSKLTHPFDRETLYQLEDDGNVRISKGNRFGLFTWEGIHISGEIRESDPQMCNWVANNPDPNSQVAPSRIAGRDGGLAV